MNHRISIFFKVIFIVILMGLSFIPFYFMLQYVQGVLDKYNSMNYLTSQAIDYASELINSIQKQTDPQMAQSNLSANYIFVKQNLISAPLTIGLILLWLLVIDIFKRLSLSLVNYFIVAFGGILFFLLELVLIPYFSPQVAYTVAAAFISLLLTFYLSAYIHNIMTTLGYFTGLAGIFSLAFMLINCADSILLYSAICLMLAFIVIIVFTRKIDWHQPAKRVEGKSKKLN